MISKGENSGASPWITAGLAVAILVLAAGGVWFFKAQQREQRQEVDARLMAIARLKADQIGRWRAERLTDAAVLMGRRALVEAVQEFLSRPTDQEKSEILRRLRPIKKRYHYGDIILVDMEKRVRLSLSGNLAYPKGSASALDAAFKEREPAWSPLHVGPAYAFPHFSVVTPLFTGKKGRRPVGALVLISNAGQFLYPLIQSWPTPSKSAETLLVRKDGNDVLFLNELRHRKNTALKFRIPLKRKDLPAAMAVAGRVGIVHGKDYRGVDVVAAVLPVPHSPWFMVAKVDSSEAFAQWRFRSLLILGLILGLLALLVAAGLIVRQYNLKAHFRERFRHEAALRQAMERHSVTLQAIGDAVIATDRAGRVELMNPAAERLTGWNLKEAEGKGLREIFRIINEKTRKPVDDPVARVLKDGEVIGLANHTLLITREGGEIPIADSGAPIRDDDGEIIGIVLVFRDQSEERLAWQLIETRFSLIEYASNHSLDGFLTRALDMVGALVKSPIGFYHFVEPDQKTLSLQQWSTRTLEEFCSAEGKGMHYGIAQAGVWTDCVKERKPVIHNDYASLPHRKGMPVGHAEVVRDLVVPVLREDKIVAILGVGNKPADYTEKDLEIVSYLADVSWAIVSQKQSEQALQESQRQLATLISNLPGMAYRCKDDADWTMEFVSDGCLSLTGYKPGELVDNAVISYEEIIHPEDRRMVRDKVQKALEHKSPFQLEYRIVTANGEGKWVWEQGRGVFGTEGNVVAIEGFITDITERRYAEEAQERLQGQLLQSQKMESVGRLAGGVAHDFNNMLSVIIGHAEMALSKVSPKVPFHQELQEILHAANRSAEITRQLLAFARKQTINPRFMNLNETVEGTLKMLGRLIGEDIDLAWRPGTDLWPVKMDPAQIDQILANLCVNARDAIEGAGKITIETENAVLDEAYCAEHAGFMPGEFVMLAVSDNGSGMDKATIEKLFEPFFTTKESGQGTGLGLATVYGIVKQNDGFINVYSEPGQGATFRIYLRRTVEVAEEKQESVFRTIQRGTETVLLVEDEESILRLGKIALEKFGYTVLAACTPEEALELVGQYKRPIHLLITDVVMPGMNGKELRERIERLKPEIKVLFMSGYAANVIVHQGILEDNVDFLAKPFSIDSLAGKAREVLDRGRVF